MTNPRIVGTEAKQCGGKGSELADRCLFVGLIFN
jgi:hypothetical protein